MAHAAWNCAFTSGIGFGNPVSLRVKTSHSFAGYNQPVKEWVYLLFVLDLALGPGLRVWPVLDFDVPVLSARTPLSL